MIAFHGKQEIKAKYLARVKEHRAADQLIKSCYWVEGKGGSAVGCTMHKLGYAAYERELGIPRILAYLEDRLFDLLPISQARDWPVQFLQAIPVGADLRYVWPRFAVWLLANEEDGAINFAPAEGQKVINDVVALFKRQLAGGDVRAPEWAETYTDIDSKIFFEATMAGSLYNTDVCEKDTQEDTLATSFAAYQAYATAAYLADPAEEPASKYIAVYRLEDLNKEAPREAPIARKCQKLLALLGEARPVR